MVGLWSPLADPARGLIREVWRVVVGALEGGVLLFHAPVVLRLHQNIADHSTDSSG